MDSFHIYLLHQCLNYDSFLDICHIVYNWVYYLGWTTVLFVLIMVLSFSALLTINSLYGFVSPLVSSILFSSLSSPISWCSVSALIILSDSIFLYTCLACSSGKYQLSLGLLLFICPPILGLRGKNVVGSFLPVISLNVLVLNFLQNLLY